MQFVMHTNRDLDQGIQMSVPASLSTPSLPMTFNLRYLMCRACIFSLARPHKTAPGP